MPKGGFAAFAGNQDASRPSAVASQGIGIPLGLQDRHPRAPPKPAPKGDDVRRRATKHWGISRTMIHLGVEKSSKRFDFSAALLVD
jgi:hypothetical protein